MSYRRKQRESLKKDSAAGKRERGKTELRCKTEDYQKRRNEVNGRHNIIGMRGKKKCRVKKGEKNNKVDRRRKAQKKEKRKDEGKLSKHKRCVPPQLHHIEWVRVSIRVLTCTCISS